jgi:hypothetical protein
MRRNVIQLDSDRKAFIADNELKKYIIPYSYNAFNNALAIDSDETTWIFIRPQCPGIKHLKKIYWSGYAMNPIAGGARYAFCGDNPQITPTAKLTDYSGHTTNKNIGNAPEEVTLPSGMGVGLWIPPDLPLTFENCVFSSELLMAITIKNGTGVAIYYSVSMYAEIEIVKF